ncbi:hypothetical protein BC830DRAFT_1170640, partial [Chytriomyces sp. MP71]
MRYTWTMFLLLVAAAVAVAAGAQDPQPDLDANSNANLYQPNPTASLPNAQAADPRGNVHHRNLNKNAEHDHVKVRAQNHGFVLPPGPLSDEDREKLVNQFCQENGIRREDLTREQHDALIERFKFLEEHRGHEKQHAEMFMILFASLIAAQILLTVWKKWHPQSFHLVSLLGLWLVPMWIGLNAGNTRFILIWLAFSLLNGLV